MGQGLRNGKVGIMQFHVFADDCNIYFVTWMPGVSHHLPPIIQIGLPSSQLQFFADRICHPLFFQHQRHFVEKGDGSVFNDAFLLQIAEQSDLFKDVFFQRLDAAKHDDVRLDAHALQFLDRVLGRFGLVFF